MCREMEKLYLDGEQKGQTKERVRNIKNLMESLGLSVEAAMNALMIPEKDRAACMGQLNKL